MAMSIVTARRGTSPRVAWRKWLRMRTFALRCLGFLVSSVFMSLWKCALALGKKYLMRALLRIKEIYCMCVTTISSGFSWPRWVSLTTYVKAVDVIKECQLSAVLALPDPSLTQLILLTWKHSLPGAICSEPVLGRKPQTVVVFTASGALPGYSADQAKMSSGSAWCARETADHLKIDLRDTYVITQLAMLGDNARGNWVKSYEVLYSRDQTNWLPGIAQAQNVIFAKSFLYNKHIPDKDCPPMDTSLIQSSL